MEPKKAVADLLPRLADGRREASSRRTRTPMTPGSIPHQRNRSGASRTSPRPLYIVELFDGRNQRNSEHAAILADYGAMDFPRTLEPNWSLDPLHRPFLARIVLEIDLEGQKNADAVSSSVVFWSLPYKVTRELPGELSTTPAASVTSIGIYEVRNVLRTHEHDAGRDHCR